MAPGSIAARLLHAGCHGVDLFFVLSGFCLSYPTLARLREDGVANFDVVKYAARRIVRIVPPYYCAIAGFVLFALALLHFAIPLPPSMPQKGFTAADVALQALFVDNRNVPLLNGSFWTLPIEFRWYFLFPPLLWVWTRSRKAFGLIALGSLLLCVTRAGSADLFVLPAFMLGIAAAALRIDRVQLGWWPPVAGIIFLFGALSSAPATDWTYDFNPLWYLAAFAFVVTAGMRRPLSWLLELRCLTAIGFASYSIYLVHEPLIAFAQAHGVTPLVAAAGGVAAGFAFWALAERPFVEGSLRRLLVAEFQRIVRSWLPRLGIGAGIALRSTPARVALAPLRVSTREITKT
jgi:peptidoglycan/LPS O-acetylase OafA/YrhL